MNGKKACYSPLGSDPEKDGWLVALAAHIYYNTTITPILEDQEYDALKEIVAMHWAELPYDVQNILRSAKEIRQTGCYIKLTKQQYKDACKEVYG